MCVIAAKYLKGFGWVGAKNRDRNYKPVISFIQSHRGDVERLMLRDDISGYTEGLNEFGICILSSATAVKDDEKEVVALQRKDKNQRKKSLAAEVRAGNIETATKSPDGVKIGLALLENTVKGAIDVIKEKRPLGNYLIFDAETCYLLEIDLTYEEREYAYQMKNEDPEWVDPTPDEREYDIIVKKIPHDEIIIRTNHGVLIDHAGYQDDAHEYMEEPDIDYVTWMKNNRVSSETRYKIVEKGLSKATSPQEILDALSVRPNEDPQLNPLRVAKRTAKKDLRTTGQLVLIPSECKFQYRSIWSTVKSVTFNKINHNKTTTYLDLLSYVEDIYESTSSSFQKLYESIISKY